jgi:virulence-associated protein VagC
MYARGQATKWEDATLRDPYTVNFQETKVDIALHNNVLIVRPTQGTITMDQALDIETYLREQFPFNGHILFTDGREILACFNPRPQ